MQYRLVNNVRNLFTKAPRKRAAFAIIMLVGVQPVSTRAQSLSEKTPAISLSAWTKQEDFIEDHVSHKAEAEMKKVVSDISSWLQLSVPFPESDKTVWSGAYFTNKLNPFPLYKYALHSDMYVMQATAGSKSVSTAYPFCITVNDLSLLQLPYQIGNEVHSSVPKMKEMAAGLWYCDLYMEGDSGSLTKLWLVSYAKSKPFRIMTRKEYLEEGKNEIENQKEALKENLKTLIPLRSAEEEKKMAEQNKQEIKNMYSGKAAEEREKIYMASLKSDSAYFKQMFEREAAPLIRDSALMDSLLQSLSPDDLSKPAFVNEPVISFSGFQDSAASSRMIISWNRDYFKKDIALTRPQFMVVSWQFNPGDPFARKLDEQLGEKLNFFDLGNMLGK